MYGNNIGYLRSGNSQMPQNIEYIPEQSFPGRGQVYQATHDGELRLPFMYRSFISFSFGGQYIQDFGIIRVTEGQRMQNNLYSDFEDLTQEYNVLNGQFYWGTHLKPLVFQYLLSTDGMTQTQLDKFKAWFAPGKIRQLVRAQHPNRGILARVQAPPVMNMLAFQGRQKKVIAGTVYNIPTTLYKGDIKISFICDDPLWYALQNLLGKRYKVALVDGEIVQRGQSSSGTGQDLEEDEFYQYRWNDANDNNSSIMNNNDALKIILQDNILTANMIGIYSNLFIGGDMKIQGIQHKDALGNIRTVAALASPQDGTNPPYAAVMISRVGVTYAPAIGTYSFIEDGQGTNIVLSDGKDSNNIAYLYYAGNAPSYPTLYFTLTPVLDEEDDKIPYIKYPLNKYVIESGQKDYNTITIEGKQKHQFRFTTPGAWNGYNQALYWFNKLAHVKDENENIIGSSWQEVKEYIRDYVTHKGARAHALRIVEDKIINNPNENLIDENEVLIQVFNQMKTFIQQDGVSIPSIFSINSKNGICAAKIKYCTGEENDTLVYSTIVENVGDMVKSNYLFLQETNHPLSSTGIIVEWDDSNEETKQCVHIIYTDLPSTAPILNFGIEYKNMYY